MSANDGFRGVSNCYVFKSRLQEYAQKVGLATPVYETIKEGPSHQPSFRSTVIVNDVRFDSLPGFFNRKAAEQSAAEVALVELMNSGDKRECISHSVHETGLCKNLLQEYAQKMNYAIPSYVCSKVESPGRVPLFSCTVDIGGIKYIGAAARTKKEAEIKAARTALLAIESASSTNGLLATNNVFTVLPCKKKATESVTSNEVAPALKPKKGRFKKKPRKKKHLNPRIKGRRECGLELNLDYNPAAVQKLDQGEACGIKGVDSRGCTEEMNVVEFHSELPVHGNVGVESVAGSNGVCRHSDLPSPSFPSYCIDPETSHETNSLNFAGGVPGLVKDLDAGQVASFISSSTSSLGEVSNGQDSLTNSNLC